MCVPLDEPEPVDSVLTFPSGYDTLEYSWVKATAVSVHLRILFVTLGGILLPHPLDFQGPDIDPYLPWVREVDVATMMAMLSHEIEFGSVGVPLPS